MSKIGCRDCMSPNCEGCNVYTLYMMLETGKFERLMNGNRSIVNIEASPHVVGTWKPHNNTYVCSVCGRPVSFWQSPFCPNCGADMRGR